MIINPALAVMHPLLELDSIFHYQLFKKVPEADISIRQLSASAILASTNCRNVHWGHDLALAIKLRRLLRCDGQRR